MDGLIQIATLVASVVTIIGGLGTVVRVVQQVMPARSKAQPEPIRVPVPMPQAADVQGSVPTTSNSPAPNPPAVPPPAPYPLPAASVPAPAFPQPAPSYEAVASAPVQQTRVGQKRRVSFLVIAFAGIATQVLYIVWAIQISLTGPDGQALWQTDSDLNNEAAALFFAALLLTFGFVIYAATKAIRLRRWGWFFEVTVGTLAGFFVLSGVALIIFGLFAPNQPRESRASIPVVSSQR